MTSTSKGEERLQGDSEEGSDYESCGEEGVDVAVGSRDADLTRPSEWTPEFQDSSESPPQHEEDSGGGKGEEKEKGEEEVGLDSTGEEKGSPEYVDEERLREEEEREGEGALTEAEREKRREECGKLKQEGNSLYKDGKPEEALQKYTAGLNLCPLGYTKDRAVLYANRAQMNRVLGHKDKAIRNSSKAIELDPEYLKAILRRAELYEETEKLDEALEDYKRVIELDSNNAEARRALIILPQKIEERNEKLKEEMMQNLKKLGNMVLKPFGLSTNNFNMVQDPSTGGYNIQFSQNK
eukprot:TRINITY_DN2202_c0_g1_i1.p1 TRINITY_DN2202_c0_g1~~TRINITY_DN2202_c0_g1_i1.p1  ORF type:complete len:309 (+),score=93.11 TRINITY_DN2202_c0_g1_i1:42-929(+)